MKIQELVQIAENAYAEVADAGLVQRAYDGEDVGDGVATFIANELTDTFDESANDHDQLREAVRCIQKAGQEMKHVRDMLKVAEDEALRGPKIDRIHGTDDIIRAHDASGGYFFSKSTMRAFQSRILSDIYKIPAEGLILFVSSEKRGESTRDYTVNVFEVKSSRVLTTKRVGDFATARGAKSAAKEMEKNNSTS